MHPFALMMHTHGHGKVVSTWRVRRNIAGRDQWSLLDKRDPLVAQHYYPIQDPSMTLVYGDQLAFRCTMVNLGEIVTGIGYPKSDFRVLPKIRRKMA